MKYFSTLAVVIMFISNSIIAQKSTPMSAEISINNPKRDVRGAWLTSVLNLDWPVNRNNSTSVQKNNLIKQLDGLKKKGINTIYFQVRPASDALYKSEIEPWSYFLTGKEGVAPSPFYDPLNFVIIEAHKRGMELHAWLNPLRAKKGSYTNAVNHVLKLHPDWKLGNSEILNPGIPDVLLHINKVVKEIVTNYDVDGIHFDDYFYPYSGTSTEDLEEFSKYGNGMTIENWRRENVNKLVAGVHNEIKINNKNQHKHIVFGISPFGIWKSGEPEGVSGTSGYNKLYADSEEWLKSGTIDYIMPQLYWSYGGGQDFGKLSQWWDDLAGENNRYHIPGVGIYRLDPNYSGWDKGRWNKGDVIKMVDEARLSTSENTYGQSFFRTAHVIKDYYSESTSIVNNQYKYPSVAPAYTWIDNIAPNNPYDLKLLGNTLTWTEPKIASDGDKARKYIVYKFDNEKEISEGINDGRKIIDVTYNTSLELNDVSGVIVVTALDGANNESIPVIFGNELSTENKELEYIKAYPNPTTKILYLNLIKGEKNIVVYNLFGAIIYSNNVTESKLKLDTYYWSNGIYFVSVKMNNKKQVVKIVKN